MISSIRGRCSHCQAHGLRSDIHIFHEYCTHACACVHTYKMMHVGSLSSCSYAYGVVCTCTCTCAHESPRCIITCTQAQTGNASSYTPYVQHKPDERLLAWVHIAVCCVVLSGASVHKAMSLYLGPSHYRSPAPQRCYDLRSMNGM